MLVDHGQWILNQLLLSYYCLMRLHWFTMIGTWFVHRPLSVKGDGLMVGYSVDLDGLQRLISQVEWEPWKTTHFRVTREWYPAPPSRCLIRGLMQGLPFDPKGDEIMGIPTTCPACKRGYPWPSHGVSLSSIRVELDLGFLAWFCKYCQHYHFLFMMTFSFVLMCTVYLSS